jgi:hypothetical protein
MGPGCPKKESELFMLVEEEEQRAGVQNRKNFKAGQVSYPIQMHKRQRSLMEALSAPVQQPKKPPALLQSKPDPAAQKKEKTKENKKQAFQGITNYDIHESVAGD